MQAHQGIWHQQKLILAMGGKTLVNTENYGRKPLQLATVSLSNTPPVCEDLNRLKTGVLPDLRNTRQDQDQICGA
jgi:hypothetical protein